MKIYTIGFTEKSAEKFFGLLSRASVSRIIDVRLNNVSQLAGFSKRDDLKYFAKTICGADYLHLLELAPTKSILDAYKRKDISWESYADKFLNLMAQRNVERLVSKGDLEDSCLLCSEHKPHQCHRRLVAEYLNSAWDIDLKITHLV